MCGDFEILSLLGKHVYSRVSNTCFLIRFLVQGYPTVLVHRPHLFSRIHLVNHSK